MAYGYWLPADSQRKGVVRWQEGPLVSLPTRSPSIPVTVHHAVIKSGLSQVTDALNDQSLRRTLSTVWNPDLEWLARHV
jgi:hypothetical protein